MPLSEKNQRQDGVMKLSLIIFLLLDGLSTSVEIFLWLFYLLTNDVILFFFNPFKVTFKIVAVKQVSSC